MTDAMQDRKTRAAGGGLAAGVVAVLLLAAPAAAEPQEQAAEFQSYRVSGWSFTPSVAIGTLYDSNLALADAPADTGRTQADSLLTIMPAGQLEFFGRRTDFSANYRGFVRRYFDVSSLDGFDQRSALTFRRAMSRRLTLFARNSFADSPTTDEIDLNGVPFRRTGSKTNTFAAGSEFRVTKFITWAARYDGTWVEFDRQDLFLTGGLIHALNNEVTYQVSSRVAAGGEYSYRTASLDEGNRELGFQNAGGVLRLTLGPRTTSAFGAGFGSLHDRNTGEKRTGPYVRMSVAHALEHATVGGGYERQYVPSFGFGGASGSQELRGYVLMPLGRQRLYTQMSGSWRRTQPFEQDTLELDTVALRATVGYAAARWARVEGVYLYTRQDSIVTGGEVDRHRIGVQFVVSQPVRIR
jgi:hypothetical protein